MTTMQRWMLTIAALGLLAGCDDGVTGVPGLIVPGTSLDGMLVVRGTANDPPIGQFCDGPPEPGVRGTCLGPTGGRFQVGFGWTAADQATLEQNWSQFDFQMFIDGRQVDLDAFGTIDLEIEADLDGDGAPENFVVRILNVVFDGLSGSHDVRTVQTIRQDVDDGLSGVFPAGPYEWLATIGGGG